MWVTTKPWVQVPNPDARLAQPRTGSLGRLCAVMSVLGFSVLIGLNILLLHNVTRVADSLSAHTGTDAQLLVDDPKSPPVPGQSVSEISWNQRVSEVTAPIESWSLFSRNTICETAFASINPPSYASYVSYTTAFMDWSDVARRYIKGLPRLDKCDPGSTRHSAPSGPPSCINGTAWESDTAYEGLLTHGIAICGVFCTEFFWELKPLYFEVHPNNSGTLKQPSCKCLSDCSQNYTTPLAVSVYKRDVSAF